MLSSPMSVGYMLDVVIATPTLRKSLTNPCTAVTHGRHDALGSESVVNI